MHASRWLGCSAVGRQGRAGRASLIGSGCLAGAAWLAAAAVLLAAAVPPSTVSAQSADALGAPVARPAHAPPVVVVAPPHAGPSSVVVVPAPPGAYGPVVPAPIAPVLPVPDSRPAARTAGYMPSWELLAPGLAAFVVTYSSALYTAVALDAGGGVAGIEWLYAPVIGPFAAAAELDADTEGAVMLGVLGVFQAAGLGFVVAGLVINRRASREAPALSIAPVIAPGHAGLVARGHF
jgi:hypothetical protein